MQWPERIVADPGILAGKPVIRGTRVAVEFILELLAAGQSEAEILSDPIVGEIISYPNALHYGRASMPEFP
jgi:hypothetical protein